MANTGYTSPKAIPRDHLSPEENFQHEFHQSISPASGKWIPCECHNGDFNAHFGNLQRVLREILIQDKRKTRM